MHQVWTQLSEPILFEKKRETKWLIQRCDKKIENPLMSHLLLTLKAEHTQFLWTDDLLTQERNRLLKVDLVLLIYSILILIFLFFFQKGRKKIKEGSFGKWRRRCWNKWSTIVVFVSVLYFCVVCVACVLRTGRTRHRHPLGKWNRSLQAPYPFDKIIYLEKMERKESKKKKGFLGEPVYPPGRYHIDDKVCSVLQRKRKTSNRSWEKKKQQEEEGLALFRWSERLFPLQSLSV